MRLPGYTLLNASGFWKAGPWQVSANVGNLTGETYFTPVADVYSNVAALPGLGRTFRVTLKRSF